MRETSFINLLRYIVKNYINNSRFDIDQLVNLTKIKQNTIYKSLQEIIEKFPSCFEIDNKRKPFQYILIDKDLLIKSVIEDLNPDFLLKYIKIKIGD